MKEMKQAAAMELVGSRIAIPTSKDKAKYLVIRTTYTDKGVILGFQNGVHAIFKQFAN